ncbi:hypothetical protein D9619_009481 [Psilocybe cf. subviscida]|uniref:DUF6534 domain-containing protein n=1 Tax=Psilocybe cf. subviscida TaxID=2480587 RepID=A0A8H5FAF8_9AGAR|nr:hypothetical protein D9619_009481 [Psilocybe cf. subviscida]
MTSNATTIAANIPADIAATTAPQLIGTLFNWLLFGVLSVQTYVYYLNFANDNIWSKVAVYGTYIFEIVQTAMTAADLYFWFASGFGNMSHIGNVNISPADTPILCGIIAAVVQFFFAYRIFTLRRAYWWISLLIVLAFKLQEYSRFHENLYFPQSFDVWLIGDTVCDVLIAGTMSWIFFVTRREGSHHGNRILGRLVRLIVETNTLTAGMALLSFICYVTLPNSPLFVCTTLIMGKLYSNTLLVTFNNRIALRNGLGQTESAKFQTSSSNSRVPIRRGVESGNEDAFYVTNNTFGVKSQELYEIRPLSGRTKPQTSLKPAA